MRCNAYGRTEPRRFPARLQRMAELGDGSLDRADSATTPQDARQRVEVLARFWSSIYIICKRIAGEELFIDAT